MMNMLEDMVAEKEVDQEIKNIARQRVMKRKLIKIISLALVVCVALVGALLVGRHQVQQKADEEVQELLDRIDKLENEAIVVNPTAPEISLSVIESEIRNIGELSTVEYVFTDAAKFSDSKQIKDWNIPFTEKSFVMKWDGSIKAGINVDNIDVNIDVENKEIVITLPQAEILSYEVDESSIEVLDEKDNVFNSISVDDKVNFDSSTKEAMIQRAIENGLLEKAQKQAEVIIAGLLTGLAEDYTITFNESILMF